VYVTLLDSQKLQSIILVENILFCRASCACAFSSVDIPVNHFFLNAVRSLRTVRRLGEMVCAFHLIQKKQKQKGNAIDYIRN